MYHVIRTYDEQAKQFNYWNGRYFARAVTHALPLFSHESVDTELTYIKNVRVPVSSMQIETIFEPSDNVPSYANSGGN